MTDRIADSDEVVDVNDFSGRVAGLASLGRLALRWASHCSFLFSAVMRYRDGGDGRAGWFEGFAMAVGAEEVAGRVEAGEEFSGGSFLGGGPVIPKTSPLADLDFSA